MKHFVLSSLLFGASQAFVVVGPNSARSTSSLFYRSEIDGECLFSFLLSFWILLLDTAWSFFPLRRSTMKVRPFSVSCTIRSPPLSHKPFCFCFRNQILCCFFIAFCETVQLLNELWSRRKFSQTLSKSERRNELHRLLSLAATTAPRCRKTTRFIRANWTVS